MRIACDSGCAKTFQALNTEKYCHGSLEPGLKEGNAGTGEALYLWLLYLNTDLKYMHFISKINIVLRYK